MKELVRIGRCEYLFSRGLEEEPMDSVPLERDALALKIRRYSRACNNVGDQRMMYYALSELTLATRSAKQLLKNG